MPLQSPPHYFLAAGRSLEGIHAIEASEVAWSDAVKALCASLGEGVHAVYGRRLRGFRFPKGTEVPYAMKLSREKLSDGKPYLVPNKARKAGRELEATMDALPQPMGGVRRMGALFGKLGSTPGTSRDDMGIWFEPGRFVVPGFEQLGDDWIITVPQPYKGVVPRPLDATPLKRSDYWLRKEAAEEAAQAASA